MATASGHDPARRRALACLAAWSGAAVVWTVSGGVPRALGATSAGTPVAAATDALTFVQISAGYDHACALTSAGAAYGWGLNSNGQLGDNTNTNRGTPTAVSGELIF